MTQVGFCLNILGKLVAVKDKPTYEVVKFITGDEFHRLATGMMNKFIVRESLTLLSGEKIIVNYIKKGRK